MPNNAQTPVTLLTARQPTTEPRDGGFSGWRMVGFIVVLAALLLAVCLFLMGSAQSAHANPAPSTSPPPSPTKAPSVPNAPSVTTKASAAAVGNTAPQNTSMTPQSSRPVAPAVASVNTRPSPERYVEQQEEYALETQRLNNLLGKLSVEEQVEQRMKSLRTARGEGTIYNTLPALIGIVGIDGRLTARLAYPDRTVVPVRIGDRLPSEHVVQVVTPHHIVLKKGNDEVRLPLIFARADQAQATPQLRAPNIPVDSAGPIVNRQSPPGAR
jgi:type IV pilus biogenesis protein PilP